MGPTGAAVQGQHRQQQGVWQVIVQGRLPVLEFTGRLQAFMHRPMGTEGTEQDGSESGEGGEAEAEHVHPAPKEARPPAQRKSLRDGTFRCRRSGNIRPPAAFASAHP
jgi:hypothetical protein